MSETLQPSHGGASSTGLDPNLAAGLAVLFAPISSLVFYLIEKNSRYVRFHAAQSLVFGGALFVAWIVLSIASFVLALIPILGAIIAMVLSLALMAAGFVGWLILLIKAFTGSEWQMPVVAPYAHKLLASNVGQ